MSEAGNRPGYNPGITVYSVNKAARARTIILTAVLVILVALAGCSDPAQTPDTVATPVPETLTPTYTPLPTETKAPEERPALAPPTTQAESHTPDTKREIISVRTGTHRTGTATPTTPAEAPTPTPTRVIPPTLRPTRTEAIPTATATPSPFAHLDVDIQRETLWRNLLDHLYPHERSCIEVEAGADGLDMPVMDDYPYALDHEVPMFACLELGTARAVLLGTMVAAFEEDDDFKIPEGEAACMRNVLAGMDAAAVVAAMAYDAEDRLPAGEFMAGIFQCIPKTLVNPLAAQDTPEDFEDRLDCTRKVLAGANADIMIALMWEVPLMWEEETREAEEFVSALWECTSLEDEYGGIPDDHADRITDATLTQAGHTLLAAVEYEHDADFFAFVAEEGIIYQIGAGLGTLEGASMSLYGPYPEYDLLHTASSHDDGQVTSIFWQSPYTDMVFVSVNGEGGTGDYSFFVQPVRLQDDHANIRGKGTALAVGQEVWGELEFYNDVDAFRMEVQEGTVYEITVDLWTLEEAVLHVEDIFGKVVEAGTGRNRDRASAVWKAEMTGFHYVLVHGDSTGTYSLSGRAWQDDHGDSSETATPLQVGEYVKSRIDTGEDIDYFVFQAEEGSSYLIESELGDLSAIALTLLDRRGEIASDDNYRRTGQPTRIRWEAPADGPYWIAANGRGPGWEGSTGTYGIVVWSRNQPERMDEALRR